MIWLNNVVRISLGGGLPLVIFVLAILAGTIALLYTPRKRNRRSSFPLWMSMFMRPDSAHGRSSAR